jgi:hypothetical protein
VAEWVPDIFCNFFEIVNSPTALGAIEKISTDFEIWKILTKIRKNKILCYKISHQVPYYAEMVGSSLAL